MVSESRDFHSLGWTFAFAILIHVLVLQVPVKQSLLGSSENHANQDPILIEKFPGEANKSVVQTSKSAEDKEADKNEAKFAGEFRNRVKKETQSSLKGRFQEGEILHRSSPEGKPGLKGRGLKSQPSQADGEAEIAEENGQGEEFEAEGPKMSDLMIIGRNPQALSKDIVEGNQTVLNTDRVLYASFINRIADEIYEPWVLNISEALKVVQILGRKLEANSYITKLNVVMDKEGVVTGITVVSGCGVPELDDAPKKAFWQTESFPHPPSQLIQEDGYIRLVYEFHFEWRSSGFNIVPWTI